jgi:hypothetical protein
MENKGLYRYGKYLAGDQGLADIDPVSFFENYKCNIRE